ncbi:protein kinase [Embleya sp. NPDC005971]|uniref:serine/threonine-protein kinase n=1 Tax=Embleya sp. NPDC005971 TaxID=3156724 RepID=UPI0033D59A70
MNAGIEPLADGDPRQVGGYVLIGRLGQGGMGRVFLGEDTDGRRVAVKLVHEEFAADPEFRTRFRREVETAERVLSYFTVPLLDSGPDDEIPWLATEFVPGPSLATAVRGEGTMSTSELCTLAAALAEALIVIHAAGLVHRDLKPSNVLIADDGPRVIDFGIARAVDADALTGTGVALGTLGYASPEQLTADGPVGPAGDVFALGGVLLFAATGHDPFGVGPPAALIFRTVHQEPDLSGVPAPLLPLIRQCLAKDPAQRPTPRLVIAAARAARSGVRGAEAAARRNAVARRAEGTTVVVSPPGSTDSMSNPEPTGPELEPHPAEPEFEPDPEPGSPASSPPDRRAVSRRRAWTIGAGLVLAVVLAIVAAIGLPDTDGASGMGAKEARDGAGTAAPAGRSAALRPGAAFGGDPLPPLVVEGERHRTWSAMPGDRDLDVDVVGLWLTADVLVRIDVSGVRAYDLHSGAQRWEVPAPVENLVPCSASAGGTATSGGVGVIGYGKPHSDPVACEEIAALDTATGTLLWHRNVGKPQNGIRLAATAGDTITVSAGDGILGLDRATGTTRWTYRWVVGDCRVTDVLAGSTDTAVSATCEPPGSLDRFARVLELDTGTGVERRRHDIPDSSQAVLLTAQPLVATYPARGRGGDRLFSFLPGDRGGQGAQAGRDAAAPPLLAERSGTVHATASLLIVRAPTPGGAGRDARSIIALDLTTGGVRWSRPLPEWVGFKTLRVGAEEMYTVEALTADTMQITRRNLSDGAIAARAALPEDFAKHSYPDHLIATGSLLIQANHSSRPALVAYDIPPT